MGRKHRNYQVRKRTATLHEKIDELTAIQSKRTRLQNDTSRRTRSGKVIKPLPEPQKRPSSQGEFCCSALLFL